MRYEANDCFEDGNVRKELSACGSQLHGRLKSGGLQFKASPAKKFMRTPSQQKKSGCGGACLSSQ
jgi:hypothetical protein